MKLDPSPLVGLVDKCGVEDWHWRQGGLGEGRRGVGILMNPHKLGNSVWHHDELVPLDVCNKSMRGIQIGHDVGIELANDRNVCRALNRETRGP